MASPIFTVKKHHPGAKIPVRGSAGAAGYDLACVEDFTISRGGSTMVDTGISIEIGSKFIYGRVAPRSGLAAKHCIDVLAGVIDSDYRGIIKVILINHGSTDVLIKAGDRIAQLIFEQIVLPDLIDGQDLTATGRGAGGFGSTG